MSHRDMILNVDIDVCNYDDVKNQMKAYYHSEKCYSVMFLNIYAFALAQKNADFKRALSRSDLVLNDGVGIEKLAKKHDVVFTHNMNGTDLIPSIIKWLSIEEKTEIFLLGAQKGIVDKAASEMEKDYDDIHISGFHHGYITEQENDDIIEKINRSKAKVLILGMGMPKQEIWIDQNKDKLKNIRIAIAGGAIIDYFSKTVKRCPDIFVRCRLEWLYRMCREPGRLWKRNVSGIYHLVKYSRKKKMKS